LTVVIYGSEGRGRYGLAGGRHVNRDDELLATKGKGMSAPMDRGVRIASTADKRPENHVRIPTPLRAHWRGTLDL
jgi:hypothetical protein